MKTKSYQTPIALLLISLAFTSCKQTEKTSPIKKDVDEAIFANGSVSQEDEYMLTANTDGYIQKLTIDEGDKVQSGEELVTLNSDASNAQLKEAYDTYQDARQKISSNSPQLLQIQFQIDQAQEELAQNEKNYKRYVVLRRSNAVSPLELENAELQYKNSKNTVSSLKKNYDEMKESLKLNEQQSLSKVQYQQANKNYFSLKADKSGIVLNVYKTRGELVKKGDNIAKIGSGSFILKMYVAEEDISKVSLGQHAKIKLNSYPDDIFDAVITKIWPAFDQIEQSFVVEAQFTQRPDQLFYGTQFQADIITGHHENSLAIPTSFLIKGQYVQLENGTQKKIVIGNKNTEWTEVLSGLTEKDVIVATKQ